MLLNASGTMVVSDLLTSNTVAGINSAGSGNIYVDNVFTPGNAVNFINGGSGDDVVACQGAMNGSGQNYFYPPLIDNQHTTAIVNGLGRYDLTDNSTTTMDTVQSEYNAAVSANPGDVIVLHLNGTYTVGANPLTLSSDTCVLLGGTIQINSSTTASEAITAPNGAGYISISGGTIDGGTSSPPAKGRDAIYFSGVAMFQIDGMTLQHFGNNSKRVGGSDVIRIDHGGTPRIVTRCTINGGSARGIWLATSGVRDVVSDNTVTDVQMDGVDCDESTSASLVKFNYLYNNGRYGVFLEQSASDNLILGNICNYNASYDIGCYNNSATYRSPTADNSIICNSLLGGNGLRNGSTGTNTVTSSDNFFFNNTVMSANIQSQLYGSQNYYSQNYTGNSSLSTSGTEVFFNSPDVSGNVLVQDSHSGLNAVVQNAAATNGAAVITGLATGQGNDEWQLIPTDSGYYRLMNENSSLAMVVLNASTNAGADIIQWAYDASGNDEWMPEPVGGGLYDFVNRLSGLELNVTDASTAAGTQLDQEPFIAAASGAFKLIDVAPPAAVTTILNTAAWTSGGAPDGDWRTAANWGNVLPQAEDWLIFGSGSQLLTTNDFPAGSVFENLVFNSGAPSFTLSGNGLVLAGALESTNGSISGGAITVGSLSNQTFNLPVTLAAGRHVITTTGGAGQLNFNGTLARNPGGLVQFDKSGGAINSSLATVNGIIGGWALNSTASALINNNGGAGTVDWAAISSGVVTAYGAYTTVSGSGQTIPSSPGSNVKVTGNGGSDDTLGSGTTTINTLYWAAANSGNGCLDIPAGDTLQLGAQGAILANTTKYFRVGNGTATGTLTAGGAANTPGELSLYNLSFYSGGALEVWCFITDNGGRAWPVTVNIFGSVNIDLANTYSGGTYISAGDAYINLGGGSFGYGPVSVYPGGRADFGGQNGITVTNSFNISGYGFLAANQPGAIKGAYNGSFTGPVTLLGSASIDPNAGAGTNTCNFIGPITGSGSLIIAGPSSGYVAGTATFGGTNSYTGDAMIDASANNNGGAGLRISTGKNNLMQNGGNLVLIGGSSGAATFDLNGTTQNINGLMATNGTTAHAIVQSSSGGGLLVVGGNNASSIFAGVIQNGGGAVALAKSGGGSLVLSGNNTYTGATTVNAGTLALSGSGSISHTTTITMAAGAILDAGSRADQTLTLNQGQTLEGGGLVNVNLTVGAGAALMPGNSTNVGTLTVASGVQLQGDTCMKLNALAGTCDQLNAGSISFGGALTVTNVAGTFAAGQSFQLFLGGSYSGSFRTISLPALGAGLVWSNSLVANGGLQVLKLQPNISSIALTGTNLTFSGTGGVPNMTYCLLAATNLALPLADWTRVLTNVFDSQGGFTVTNLISGPEQYYLIRVP
jgi:autotransporter-associated beta strand protein